MGSAVSLSWLKYSSFAVSKALSLSTEVNVFILRLSQKVPFNNFVITFFPLVIKDLNLYLSIVLTLLTDKYIAIIKLINVNSDLRHGLDNRGQLLQEGHVE